MSRKPKPPPPVSPGVYRKAAQSYLAIVVRVGTKLVYYATMDYPMTLRHASWDRFLNEYPLRLDYVPDDAARRWLATQPARTSASRDVRVALESMSGYDLLDTSTIFD